VDKENCRPEEIHEMIFDLFFALDATEDQLDFPVIYGSSKQGWMSTDWKTPTTDFTALLDAILQYIPAAPFNEGTLQMQVTSLDYSSFVGRIAIGRVSRTQRKPTGHSCQKRRHHGQRSC
jgi:GTP-binding protein